MWDDAGGAYAGVYSEIREEVPVLFLALWPFSQNQPIQRDFPVPGHRNEIFHWRPHFTSFITTYNVLEKPQRPPKLDLRCASADLSESPRHVFPPDDPAIAHTGPNWS